jgi:hypothetical protein
MSIQDVFNRLRTIRELTFEANSRSVTNTGWNGAGRGTVRVEEIETATILFHEMGSWTTEQGREITFNNIFRWTIDPIGNLIRLEHLRFGAGNPVYLFDLIPASEDVLESGEPHVCRNDLYSARMECDQSAIHVSWTISGPGKDERIAYSYR